MPPLTTRQIKDTEAIAALKNEKEILLQQRMLIPNRMKLKDMPDAVRYDKLRPESKLFMNVIKMICYRAETAMSETIAPYFYFYKEKK